MPPEDNTTPEAQVLAQGTPEYDAAMVEKFDDAQLPEGGDQTEQPGNQDERPSWLPAKFTSAEDMAKAYAALEAKQSQGGDTPAADADTTSQDEAAKLVTDAGLDFDALSTKFASEGALSDTDYTDLEKAGIPRAMVDAYIEGQTAIANGHRTALLSTVGGEAGFTAVSTWAADNLEAGDIEAFNAVMDGGDMGAMKLALAGLKAGYDAAMGDEPTLLGGDNTPATGDVFRSTAELTAAMKDPRYSKDPAYRRDIEQKLARSNSVF
jgi:hypothetical protein